MIIIKPEWISHGEQGQDSKIIKSCIYSLHVHPDGKRLATGSSDGKIKIWNIDPIFDEKAEHSPDCHKLLCSMHIHTGAVLCIRWSNNNGQYLASSSDNDNVIIIWEQDRSAPITSVFGTDEINYETWKAMKYLKGHQSDIQDLAWSKDNEYLASCSVDGHIIIWDGSTFEQIKMIHQHNGPVKGVTWDPAGKFLASQSDDKMVKVWKTSDWSLETELTTPFINATSMTLFKRLSWSPDGAHIAAANAVNGVQCIAAVINRDIWNADISLVGHQLPIEVTSFNPKMFYMKDNNNNEKSLATICALGSQDRSISIWVTKFSRPICVAADVFDNNIYDICWTPDGKSLFACSQDGTIACIQLHTELENAASDDDILKELTKYGYGKKVESSSPKQFKDIVPKSNTPNRITELMTGNSTISTTPMDIDKESTEDTTSSNLLQQKVSILSNGKKQVTPTIVSSSTNLENNTVTNQLQDTQTTQTTTKVVNHVDQIEYDDPESGSAGNKRKLVNDNNNQVARKRPEWIDSAVISPQIQKSQVRMAIPKVKSVLSSKLRPNDSTILTECHNSSTSEDESTSNKSKIVTSKQGVILWTDYIPSTILLITGNEFYSAIGCEDGSIYVYSTSGKRLLPPMVMESTPVLLQCKQEWLLCITATGLLYIWDVMRLKNHLNGISIAPLLQSAQLSDSVRHIAPIIKDARLQKNGVPILITNLQQAFMYHSDMKTWMRISDAWYIISEFWGSDLQTNQTKSENPLGWLHSRVTVNGQGLDPTSQLILDIAKTDEKTTAIVTVSHIETQLAVAALLESPNEYSNWMIYYAKKLSEENLKDKADELCRWLMGPPFTQSEFGDWEPKIMGTLLKKDLLKQILPVLAQNRQLQRLVVEFKSLI